MSSPPQASHAADRLLAAINDAPVCVGIDPVLEKLPATLRSMPAAAAIEAFSAGVIEAVASHVGCVKIQAACFERYGVAGIEALRGTQRFARGHGLQVILDAKRGDIGISAEHYAAAVFDDEAAAPDWITINGYLGADGIRPFLRPGRGAFVLVRTSNPGGDAVQTPTLDDGRSVAELVADMVAALGAEHVGESGYSALGAVVGATKSAEAAALRKRMPQQVLLVPGFGAQGAGLDDLAPCFAADGRGALVTASRSVIYAFDAADPQWADAVGAAARELATQVSGAVEALAR